MCSNCCKVHEYDAALRLTEIGARDYVSATSLRLVEDRQYDEGELAYVPITYGAEDGDAEGKETRE